MDYLYKTVLKRARIEYVVERSRFIATVLPCESREEVDSFFNEIRQEFKDATHNVPAFVLGNKMELKWASDDGEPQGTSGPPILKVLEGKGLTNLALVVTRYFGGIKLGTGGLVRAYSQSAEEVIREAGIAGAAIFLKYKVSLSYPEYNKFISYRFPSSIKDLMITGEPEFGENVTLDVSCHYSILEPLKNTLRDITNGSVILGDNTPAGEENLLRFALTMDS